MQSLDLIHSIATYVLIFMLFTVKDDEMKIDMIIMYASLASGTYIFIIVSVDVHT